MSLVEERLLFRMCKSIYQDRTRLCISKWSERAWCMCVFVCGCTLRHCVSRILASQSDALLLNTGNSVLLITCVSVGHSSCQVLEKFMSRLVQNRVMAHKDLRTLSKYQLILARDQFRKNPPPNIKARTLLYESLGAIAYNSPWYDTHPFRITAASFKDVWSP